MENSPYLRVRVRRCSMGPNTVPKIESEKVILTAVKRYLEIAEKDYKILMSKGIQEVPTSQ